MSIEVLEKQENKFENAMKNFRILRETENEKFSTIDNWLEKESNLFLQETKRKKNCKYKHFKRGTLIKVDFGVNLGSELCFTHFAIVLSNNDNIKQDSITVLPLTSKPGVGRLQLGDIIKKELVKNIKNKTEKRELSELEIKNLLSLMNKYKKYKNLSYAFISQITTISKSRIIYSTNEFDIINKTRCSAEILNEIDEAILGAITGKVK